MSNSDESTNGNFESRTFGSFPEGTLAAITNVDTKNYIEQGEKTWTTGQTIRDILQNSLDASTERYVEELLSNVIDLRALEREKQLGISSISPERFEEFSFELFRYKQSMNDLSEESKRDFLTILDSFHYEIPFKDDLLGENRRLRLDKLDSKIEPIIEVPPTIIYKIIDAQSPDKELSVTLEELQSEQFNDSEEISSMRWQVVGIKIQDNGMGFDSKLSAYYMSTKTGKRYFRGKFGEGSKLSETHIVRNGGTLKQRSGYVYEPEKGLRRHRLWQHRPVIGEDDVIKQKGVELELPYDEKRPVGTEISINIRKANPEFQKEFRENIDPRVPSGLAANCLEYSNVKYHYPQASIKAEYGISPIPTGVSIDAYPKNQYVQGLKVGDGTFDRYGSSLFSYNFLDSSLLKGRDRNELADAFRSAIITFWSKAEDRELVHIFLERVLVGDHNFWTPEVDAFRRIMESGPHYPSIKQEARVYKMFMNELPQVLGIKEGTKHILVPAYEFKDKSNSILFKSLTDNGYILTKLETNIDANTCKNLNSFHENSFEVSTLGMVREQKASMVQEVSNESEENLKVKEIYNQAFDELYSMLSSVGMISEDTPLSREVAYFQTVDARSDEAVEASFDNNNGSFKLIIRPDLITSSLRQGGLGVDYWKNRIQINLLSTLGRFEDHKDKDSALIFAQTKVQELLNLSIPDNSAEMQILPKEGFGHLIDDGGEDEVNQFTEKLKEITQGLKGLSKYHKAIEYFASINDFEDIVIDLDILTEEYKDYIYQFLSNRISVIGEDVAFISKDYDYGTHKDKIKLNKYKISDLKIIGEANGKPIYLADKHIFILNNFASDSIVNLTEDKKLVFFNNQLLQFGDSSFELYKFDLSNSIILNNGCISAPISPYQNDYSESIRYFTEALGKLKVTSPEKKETNQMRQLSGKISTPIPIEYGKGEWDNPVRVFQDILQNHIDASPDGKVLLQYEVERNGERIWVEEGNLNKSDVLVGFQVFDKGSGYIPDNLGTMGKSSKKSPMFAGKYGEGQKMISAASARNGLDLRFSSISIFDNKPFRWLARVGTQKESVNVAGKSQATQRVIYDFNSVSVNPNHKNYSSFTTLRLHDNPTKEEEVKWNEWKTIIDPRIKNEHGYGGLSRFIINLRNEVNPNVIDLGYMKILLDEPGAVYENGLLISIDSNSMIVGYDVPEVVKTRERNSFNSSKLDNYISHVMQYVSDPRYIDKIVSHLNQHYISNRTSNKLPNYFRENELNFQYIIKNSGLGFIPTQPLWRAAAAKYFNGKFIYSEESIKQQIEFIKGNISMSSNTLKAKTKLDQLHNTLAQVTHLSTDELIEVSKDSYEKLSLLFPNVEEFARSIAEQEVEVNPATLDHLKKLVEENAQVFKELKERLLATPEGEVFFYSIFLGKKPNELVSNILGNQDMYYKYEFDNELSNWLNVSSNNEVPHKVFVSPKNSGYLGIQSKNRIGINEILLSNDANRKELIGIARHELAHKLFELGDYSTDFISVLLELSKQNLKK